MGTEPYIRPRRYASVILDNPPLVLISLTRRLPFSIDPTLSVDVFVFAETNAAIRSEKKDDRTI